MITTIEKFVEAAGGIDATAQHFGVVRTAVYNWEARGRFPGWALPKAQLLAQTNSWALSPALFTATKPQPRDTKVTTPAKLKPKSKVRGRARKISLSAAE